MWYVRRIALTCMIMLQCPAQIIAVPTATIDIETEIDGTFEVFLSASGEDHFGLAAYSIPIIGDVFND